MVLGKWYRSVRWFTTVAPPWWTKMTAPNCSAAFQKGRNSDKDAKAVSAMAQECNDYVSQLTKDHPDRFSGFCTLPMQDVRASVAELERGVTQLGLKGAMVGDNVNGKNYDDPE